MSADHKLPHRESPSPPADAEEATSRPSSWGRILWPVAVFIWPFIYLFNQVIPINGKYTGIDNDFGYAFYNFKFYLLDQLSTLHFPLWSPSEGAGFPFYSNPLPATLYPLNIPLALFYKLAGGYTIYDHQLFAILGVSIFALGLFHWLRLLPLPLRSVLFATFVMSVSFKVTETLRFPNSIHTAAWYPWLLFALTQILRRDSARRAARDGLLLAVFFVCLLTGGYPYFVYYAIFLLAPYLLIFLVPSLRERLWRQPIGNLRTSFAVIFAAGLAACLLCAPYLFQMSRLMRQTVNRGGGDFAYATEHEFRFVHTIGSLVFPPASQPEGWYYFGLLGFLLILLYLFGDPLAALLARRAHNAAEHVKPAPWYQDHRVKLFFIIWIAAISYITYGRDSYLFIFLWKYMPQFANLRVWGRLNIILVPIIAWLLALAYMSFEAHLIRRESPPDRGARRLLPVAVLILGYSLALTAQLYFFKFKLYDYYWAKLGDFAHVRPKDSLFIITGALGFLTLLLLMLPPPGRFRAPRSLALILLALVLVSTLDMRPVGSQMWTYPATMPGRARRDVAGQNRNSFNVPRTDKETLLPPVEPFSVGKWENWFYKRYVQFLEATAHEPEARRKLLGVADGQKLYLSQSINHPTIRSFLDDAARSGNTARVVSYDGDELILDINAPVAGYLSFIDNWDADWQATIDAQPVPIELLFGTFKSIRLTAGEHRVVFVYRPKFFSCGGRTFGATA